MLVGTEINTCEAAGGWLLSNKRNSMVRFIIVKYKRFWWQCKIFCSVIYGNDNPDMKVSGLSLP